MALSMIIHVTVELNHRVASHSTLYVCQKIIVWLNKQAFNEFRIGFFYSKLFHCPAM